MLSLKIFLFYCFSVAAFSLEKYVTSVQSCGTTCSGDIDNPYDNLLIALNSTQAEYNVTIYLLNGPTPHYILSQEYNQSSPSDLLYHFSVSQTLSLATRVIQPVFCGEEPVISNPSLASQCISRDQKLTVYVKTTEFTLSITQSMQIYNIIFDASEDIKVWNSGNTDLEGCIYKRKRCCEDPNSPSVASLKCRMGGDYSGMGLTPTASLFSVKNTSDPTLMSPSVSFTTYNTSFVSFISPNLLSLIYTGPNYYLISLNNGIINEVYFAKGFIYHNEASATPAFSSITLLNMQFSNYNPTDLLTSAKLPEGYLIFAPSYYLGTLTIQNSGFTNATSALRSQCAALTDQFYNIPMNNMLWPGQMPRTNLWNLFHADHLNTQNSSSLIFFTTYDGVLALVGSTFKNIIGTSGSVLRVDDILQSFTSIQILNSLFDNNFAYDGFPNIRISKSSGGAFSKMLECPRMTLSGSNFTNAYGCPGSYGNVLLLCYWDTAPIITGFLSLYNIFNNGYYLPFWWAQAVAPPNAYMTVINCLFENNLMSVSNSLAVIGSAFTYLEGNTFRGNGGTSAQIIITRLNGSYFYNRYAPSLNIAPIHFGQSTAFYMDHFIRFQTVSNQFIGNWGPWEGSLSLGESMTLKNWIRLANTINFYGDYFGDHQGIPPYWASAIQDISLKSNIFMAPMITLSYDDVGTQYVFQQLFDVSLIYNTKITFNSITFNNNTASYSYFQRYTYNLIYVGPIFSLYGAQARFKSGFLKLLTTIESQDFPLTAPFLNPIKYKVGVVFINATITMNRLLSTGCLFSSQWADSYFFSNSQISGNTIYPDVEYFPVLVQDQPELTYITNNTHGLICASLKETMVQSGFVTVGLNNVTAKHNIGILFNSLPGNGVFPFIIDSHFENNSCQTASMISLFSQTFMLTKNTTFINNFNALGNIFVYQDTYNTGVFNTYLNNSGIHASIIFMANTQNMIQTEMIARAYWNKINPSIPLFASGTMAQGAPFFFIGVYVWLGNCDFRQNTAYSGLINGMESNIYMNGSVISDHYIAGVSVIANLMSGSNFILANSQATNNSITTNPNFVTNYFGILMLYNARLMSVNTNFMEGTIAQGGVLIFGNTATAFINGGSIQNYTKLSREHDYLIWFTFMNANINNLFCNNITNLFNMVGSNVNVTGLTVQNLQSSFNSQFIIQSSESQLKIKNLSYIGNGETGSTTSLISGDTTSLMLFRCTFINATNKVIQLQNSPAFYVGNSNFLFDKYPNQVTTIDLTLSQQAVIDSCVFSAAGQVLTAASMEAQVVLVNNVIITNSGIQNILINSAMGVFMNQNHLISEGLALSTLPPPSQVQIIDSSSPIVMTNNNLWSLQSLITTVLIQSRQYAYDVTSFNNAFINNKASYGGALQLDAAKGWTGSQVPKARIINSNFISNAAKYFTQNGPGSGRAGAIYLKSTGFTTQETVLENSFLTNNQADGVGGAIYFEYSSPNISQGCTFKKNSIYAVTGLPQPNHISSYPVRLVTYDESMPSVVFTPNQAPMRLLAPGDQNTWQGIGSGVETPGPYKLALLDMHNQLVGDDNSSELQVWPDGYTSNNRSAFTADLSFTARRGIYTLQDFTFTYKVQGRLNVQFNSSAIQNNPNNPYINVSNSINIEVDFRECKIGEYTFVAGTTSKCIECQAGYWYLSETSNTCTECNMDSTICLGGSNVGPRPGYWRLNEMASIVKECPNQNACLGNVVNQNDPNATLNPTGECAEGFTGNLCNNCIDGWAKTSSTSRCVNCHTNVRQYLQLAGLILLQVAFLAYNVKKTMEIASQYFTDKGNIEVRNNAAILLRILTNYMQMIALVEAIPISWPQVMKETITVTSKTSSSNTDVFSIDCFFLLLKESSGIRLVFLKILLNVMTPFIYIVGGTIFWLVYFLLKKKAIFSKNFLNKLITTVVIICFNLQPSIVKTSFELFQCENLYREDSPILFLTSDYDVQCWDTEHFKWAMGLGLPCLLFWGIGLPLCMFLILRRNSHKLDSPEIVKKHVFLYLGYRQDRFYWEFIIMLRKLTLICVTVFAGFHSINLQIYLVVIVSIISIVIQQLGKPYNTKNLNRLESISLVSAAIVDFCGLYFQFVGDLSALNIIILVIGFLGNLHFIIEFLRFYFIYQQEQIKKNKKAMKILNWLGDKLCCCFKTKKAKQTLTKAKTNVIKLPKLLLVDEKLTTPDIAIGFQALPLDSSPDYKLTRVLNNLQSLQDSPGRSSVINLVSYEETPRTERGPPVVQSPSDSQRVLLTKEFQNLLSQKEKYQEEEDQEVKPKKESKKKKSKDSKIGAGEEPIPESDKDEDSEENKIESEEGSESESDQNEDSEESKENEEKDENDRMNGNDEHNEKLIQNLEVPKAEADELSLPAMS